MMKKATKILLVVAILGVVLGIVSVAGATSVALNRFVYVINGYMPVPRGLLSQPGEDSSIIHTTTNSRGLVIREIGDSTKFPFLGDIFPGYSDGRVYYYSVGDWFYYHRWEVLAIPSALLLIAIALRREATRGTG